MKRRYLTLFFALGFSTAGAASAAEPTTMLISNQAAMALSQAESDVKMAKRRQALWTTAQNSLDQAREAARKGDSVTVLLQSTIATEHALLGIAQLGYTSTEQ